MPAKQNRREPGVSIIAGVMNRTEPLRYSLANWLDLGSWADEPIRQIILIDWSSEDVIDDDRLAAMNIPGVDDPRLTIVNVAGQESWRPGACWNLAARFVTQHKILKLDADICVVRADLMQLESGQFFANPWHGLGWMANEIYTTGSWFGWTRDFLSVGGYDERLDRSYGYDDDSLYDRMTAAGLKRERFQRGTLWHLPHSEAVRFRYYSDDDPGVSKAKAAYLSQRQKWSLEMARQHAMQFEIIPVSENRWAACERPIIHAVDE